MNCEKKRLLFLDNLKTFIIFLVVLYHCGWVYEKSGILSSVWIVDDPLKNDSAGLLNLIMDMFMMPILFFISGYFTPSSLKSKTGWIFLKSRFKRMMVPWIFAVLTLLPLYKVIFLYSRNLPQENLFSYFHFTGGILINQGWLWFLPVLFLFDLVYLGLDRVNSLKLKISLKGTLFAIFFIGFAYSFCMSFFNYYGWTKTVLLDFQNEKILIYFMAFVFGSLCYRLNVLNTKPDSKKLYYLICSTIWIPMNVYIIFLINIFFNPGHYIISHIVDVMLIWLGFHVSLFGMMYVIINTFRYYLNKTGRLLNLLNSYSYGVYIIHFVVMGAIACALLNVNISSISKYAILTISSLAASNLIVAIYKKSVQKKISSIDKHSNG